MLHIVNKSPLDRNALDACLRIGAPVEGVIQPASARTGGQAIMRWRPSKES